VSSSCGRRGNVKYDNFMEPGRRMQVSVELTERGAGVGDVQGQRGEVEGQPTVSGGAPRDAGDVQPPRQRPPAWPRPTSASCQHLRSVGELLRRAVIVPVMATNS